MVYLWGRIVDGKGNQIFLLLYSIYIMQFSINNDIFYVIVKPVLMDWLF